MGKLNYLSFLNFDFAATGSEHSRKPSERCFKWRISAQNGGFKFCNSALLFFINSYSLRVRKEAVSDTVQWCSHCGKVQQFLKI